MPIEDYVYSDFDKNLTVLDDGNVKVLYNEDVVIQSIKTIIATAAGERVRTDFGGSLLPLLFEPMDEYLADDIESALTRVILENEPRVKIQRIDISLNPDQNTIEVFLALRIDKINRTVRYNTSLRSFA